MLRSMDSNSTRDLAKQLKLNSKLDESAKQNRNSRKALESTNYDSHKTLKKIESHSSIRSRLKKKYGEGE